LTIEQVQDFKNI